MDSGPLHRPTAVSAVIGELYDAALHGDWDDALESLCGSMGWEGVALHACAADGSALAVGYGIGYGADTDTPGIEGAITRLAKPAGGCGMGLPYTVPQPRLLERRLFVAGAIEACMVYRPRDTLDTQDLHGAWAELCPHLQRALAAALERVRTTWRMRQLECEADCMPYGRIVLDAHLHILHANRALRTMAATGDAFRIVEDRLELRRGSDRAAIVAGMRAFDRGHERPFVVNWPRSSGCWPYLARLTALERGARASYELTVIDREPAESVCAPVMLAGFDLTRAEARVARLLVEGLSSEEIAAQCGIARGTMKLHVQHAMAKLGVRRRSEFVRRVLAPWLALAPDW